MKNMQLGFGFFGFLAVLVAVAGLALIFGPFIETTCVPPSKEEIARAERMNETLSSPLGTKATAEEKCTTKIYR